jgi:hypothetical protein
MGRVFSGHDQTLGGFVMDSLLSLGLVVWVGLAWLTHVIVCISTSKWVFLLAGAIFFPVGCVHGTGVWFGFF